MRLPTCEQREVLNSNARVRVVHACPGSGKTWLVAEVIRQELGTWVTKTSGIAALSFTRVGGEEIRKAVGYELGHPHFIGTIDAFIFRYVIRPHLRQVFNWFAGPRLVPGEWGAEHWRKCGPNQKATFNNGINLFGCVCIGEEQGETIISHKRHPALPLQRLTGDDLLEVREAKERIWQQRGLLTHSDAALWATKILEHERFGPVVRREIMRRFPFLVVDELQDTGHFLGKSIRLLLGEPAARGVLVGDPDQAIFEFTGARPDLFEAFSSIANTKTFPLAASRRCPLVIAKAATHLKDSGGAIGPAKGRVGRAILVRYRDMVVEVPKVVDAIRASQASALLKIIARGGTTVEELSGRRTGDPPSLYCRPLTHIHNAVVKFRRSRNTAALAAMRAALELAFFQHEGVTEEELAAVNIDLRDWKAHAIRCLLKANTIVTSGTFFDWQTQAGRIIDEEMSRFALSSRLNFIEGKLNPQRRGGWDQPSREFLPQPGDAQILAGVPVQTVHGVKGETHDVTVFVCPQTNAARCPSTIWWSQNGKDREEKRIAYVAMTRTQGSLIMCVSNDCYERLLLKRAAFVASFECMTVEECITVLDGGAATSHGVGTGVAADNADGEIYDSRGVCP